MKPMKLFWGLIIALTGFLILGMQQNWVSEDVWLKLIFLWPVIIIVWGLSLIFKNNKVLIVLILLIFALIVWFISTDTGIENRQVNLGGAVGLTDNVTDVSDTSPKKINISLGASKIKIDSLSDIRSKMYLLEYDAKGYSEIITEPLGVTDLDSTKIYEKEVNLFWFNYPKREFNAHINRVFPIDLTLNCGASVLDLNLEDIKITDLTMDSGASTANVALGNRVDEVNVNVKSGASSFVFDVPADSGVKIVFSSGKVTNSLTDNIGLKKDGDIYYSENYNDVQHKIMIDIESGVTSVTLNQY